MLLDLEPVMIGTLHEILFQIVPTYIYSLRSIIDPLVDDPTPTL